MTAQVATIGHNHPPDEAAILRDNLAITHADLIKRRDELIAGVGRAPATIEDDVIAGKVADFVKQISAAEKAAEAKRVAAKEPYLAAGRVVDGFFKDITGKLADARKTLLKRITAYQQKKAAEERQRREEEARRAREEALRAKREAAERAAALSSEEDLNAAIAAEETAAQKMQEADQAVDAAKAKPAELSRTRGTYGAVSSLRTDWVFKDLDRETLDLETLRPFIPLAALEQAVRGFIKSGGRELRGVRIVEETTSVVR